MKTFEAAIGTWKIVDETVTFTIDASLRGYALAGSETEDNITVEATAKLVVGSKIGLIIGYTQEATYEENFLECYLDIANDKVKIDAVVADVRANIASRDYALAVNTEYKLKAKLVQDADGTATLTFYVDGVAQFPAIDDLNAIFQTAAGLYGLVAEGTLATDNGVFSKIRKYTAEALYCTLDQAREVLQQDETLLDYDEEIIETIQIADEMIDAELATRDLTADSTSRLIQQAAAHLTAYLVQKKRFPTQPNVFKEQADEFLKQYIGKENFEEPSVRRG